VILFPSMYSFSYLYKPLIFMFNDLKISLIQTKGCMQFHRSHVNIPFDNVLHLLNFVEIEDVIM